MGFDSIFTVGCQAAILWRLASRFLPPDTPPTRIRSISRSSPILRTNLTDAVFVIAGEAVRVAAIYVPCRDSQTNGRSTKEFLYTLSRKVPAHSDIPLLLGGDWNCVEDNYLDGMSQFTQNAGKEETCRLARDFALSDPYRSLYPLQREYTNYTGITRADRRIDRFYLSPLLASRAVRQRFLPRPSGHLCSSHKPIELSLASPGAIEHGTGAYKIGTHLLKITGFVEYFLYHVPRWYQDALTEIRDPFEAWDQTKLQIAQEASCISRHLARMSRPSGGAPLRSTLQGHALRAHLDPANTSEYAVKQRLKIVRQADTIAALQPLDNPATAAIANNENTLATAHAFYTTLYETKPTC